MECKVFPSAISYANIFQRTGLRVDSCTYFFFLQWSTQMCIKSANTDRFQNFISIFQGLYFHKCCRLPSEVLLI